MQIKLLLACKDKRFASELCADLVDAAEGLITGAATDMPGVLRAAEITRPDVLVLEHMPGEEQASWNLLARFRNAGPGTRVLLLCDAYAEGTLIACLRHGASGCLRKSSAPLLQAKAVSHVFRGEIWFGRSELLKAVRSQIALRPVAPAVPVTGQEPLTAREREILDLIGHALSNKEIARELNISDKTVKTHLQHIYSKLQLSGRYKAFLSESAAAARQ
jgi:DNA-binding NarL/FixJ family response regulator